jgi:transcriptional regulator with XRE-family HTH domain
MSAMADAKRSLSFQEKIGSAVRSARGLDRSQEYVARKAGITRSHLRNIELGKVDVSVHVLYLIAKATGTTLSKILKDLG